MLYIIFLVGTFQFNLILTKIASKEDVKKIAMTLPS